MLIHVMFIHISSFLPRHFPMPPWPLATLSHAIAQYLEVVFPAFLHPWKLTWHWKIPMFNRKNIFKTWMFFSLSSWFSGEKNLQTHRDHKMAPTFEFKFPVVHCGCEACVMNRFFSQKRSKTNHRSLTAKAPEKWWLFKTTFLSYWVKRSLIRGYVMLNFGWVPRCFFCLFVDDFGMTSSQDVKSWDSHSWIQRLHWFYHASWPANKKREGEKMKPSYEGPNPLLDYL